MNSEYTIVGGGIAGLSAALHLLERGVSPLVIEAGKYPAHKVCGEFFSARGVALLKKWGIEPIEIAEIYFHVAGETLHCRFPRPFGSLSHLQADPLLAQKCQGADFLTETKVVRIEPGKKILLELSSGEKVKTSHLILATGRVANMSFQPVYKGFKAHVEGNLNDQALEMFLFEGGYMGISPIEGGKFNVAGIVKGEVFQKWGSIEALLNHWKEQNPGLATRLPLSYAWMEASIPKFGRKTLPKWPNTYFVGDAASTIPPITGNGLTLGMESGIMAASYALQADYQGFLKASQALWSCPVFWGKVIHTLAMQPYVPKYMLKWGGHRLVNALYYLTR